MKRYLSCLLAGICSLTAPVQAQDPAESATAFPGAGLQTRWMDASVRPGDDFMAYVNGKWLRETEIPADKSTYGTMNILTDVSRDRLRMLMDEALAAKAAPGSDTARIAAAYGAFMDTQAIDAAGLAPARPWLQRIAAARKPQDLARLFGDPAFESPIAFFLNPDAKDSGRYALQMSTSGLGLPDRNYYLIDTPRNVEIRARYMEWLAFALAQAGDRNPAESARAVYALERKIAEAHWDRALGRNRDLTYNKLTLAEARSALKGLPLDMMLASAGARNVSALVISQMPPSASELAAAGFTPDMAAKLGGGVPAIAALVGSEPVAAWKAWMTVRFLTRYSAVLPSAIDNARFTFYGKVLRGQPVDEPRWKRGIAATEEQVGELVGKAYAQKWFPPQNKAAMEALVGNLRKAMSANLADLAWMSPATRTEAEAKLAAFTPKIGYPDKYKTYEGLSLSARTPLANAIAARGWQQGYDMPRIGQPVDRSEWGMLPQTVNAYYSSTRNEIVFPAAILQPPFFNLSADPAVNYGAIGAVIGHEMGHGFDDQGAKSDGAGNLRNWWTDADRASFNRLTARLVAQYDAFCPFDAASGGGKACINGTLTLGENIGDLGGLSLALRAYRLSLGGKPAPVIDGLTGEQRFFMAWAQGWRFKAREAAARDRLETDPHSPAAYRVNGIVRNFDEWYAAFGVKPGDALYLPPEQRIRIW
ncbi:MAG: M13 family peptidase [Novosphingobium sp.]|nr:M13 family peptidase [Novosphingobium sp.]